MVDLLGTSNWTRHFVSATTFYIHCRQHHEPNTVIYTRFLLDVYRRCQECQCNHFDQIKLVFHSIRFLAWKQNDNESDSRAILYTYWIFKIHLLVSRKLFQFWGIFSRIMWNKTGTCKLILITKTSGIPFFATLFMISISNCLNLWCFYHKSLQCWDKMTQHRHFLGCDLCRSALFF